MGFGDILILGLVLAGIAGAVAFICKNGGFSGSCGGACAHCASRCGKEQQPGPGQTPMQR